MWVLGKKYTVHLWVLDVAVAQSTTLTLLIFFSNWEHKVGDSKHDSFMISPTVPCITKLGIKSITNKLFS